MTLDQLLAAAGITPEQLVGYLQRLAVLGDVAAQKAKIDRLQHARQVEINRMDDELRVEQAALAALEAQANAILAP